MRDYKNDNGIINEDYNYFVGVSGWMREGSMLLPDPTCLASSR